MKRILIIDDEFEVQNFFSFLLRNKGFDLSFASNKDEIDGCLACKPYQLALVDLKLPDTDGITILKDIKQRMPACKVVIMTGYSTVKSALEAIRLGADDYIEKPFDDITELELLIDKLLTSETSLDQDKALELAEQIGFVIGESQKMHHLLSLAYKVAQKNVTLLIEGETGTGKEVLARFIHEASSRLVHPFIGVNCGALTETLLESELFGHEKGAFTGATQLRKGFFEIASKGTLFLDEIGDASPSIQVKLLRILETREFMRVGSERHLHTDTRIIAASHIHLNEAVNQGKFREDLLYRLDVVKLHIPPLRERKEDIPFLAKYLLKRHAAQQLSFSSDAVHLMEQYGWPGNVRELSNVITRAITFADGETTIITPEYLSINLEISKHSPFPQAKQQEWVGNQEAKDIISLEQHLEKWKEGILSQWKSSGTIDLPSIMEQTKKLEQVVGTAFVKKALRETIGNRKEASRLLNISPRNLRYLLNEKGKDC
ncbi:sigma-54 dependent transcriptional regulator [Aneurinibacillus sp. Ricciae_BoGa-3]|uniref:sigma-54-dependent transcriptional regulator n=1 Tax=Aneurinibacillus sp. Ricciae_BoGa-3 TaxID=3022697 RepID=UPI00234178EC|nr:sigma-54 dependent transcriptional regulator [Aneurinibacillus sp. Ricciae_BoGa-3]WCK52563.1 sigma-54 dependent transcriptional regulator [Aneurinibacillus sp. Ricciae_BoGa-3]